MLAAALVILGAAGRLLPHLPNFTPLAAVALFGGVYLRKRYSLLLPLLALVASDAVIGFDSWTSRLTVYGSFAAIGLIGLAIRRCKTVFTVFAGTVGGSVLFYLVTNFAYFYEPTLYPHSLAGVMQSYYMALPFFRNSLIGDLFFTGILFGSYELIRMVVRRRAAATLPAST